MYVLNVNKLLFNYIMHAYMYMCMLTCSCLFAPCVWNEWDYAFHSDIFA